MFMYGCPVPNFPLETREFPWILSKISPLFSFHKSSFFIQSYKLGAARIALFQDLKIKCSYTLETSFFGSEKSGKHFTINELLEFGGDFCQAILLQFSRECSSSKKQAIKEVDQEVADLKQKMIEEFYSSQENMNNLDPDSGSESEISDDELSSTALKSLFSQTKKRTVRRYSQSPNKSMKTLPNISESPSPTHYSTTKRLSEARNLIEKRSFSKEKSFQKSPNSKKVTERSPGKNPQSSQSFKNLTILSTIGVEYNEQTSADIFGPWTLTDDQPPEEKNFATINSKRYRPNEALSLRPERKLLHAPIAFQERRIHREKEENIDRISKQRAFQYINTNEINKPSSVSVVTVGGEFSSVTEKSLISPDGLKHIKSLKEGQTSAWGVKVFGTNPWIEQNIMNEKYETLEMPDIQENSEDKKEEKNIKTKATLYDSIINTMKGSTKEEAKDWRKLRSIKLIGSVRETSEAKDDQESETKSRLNRKPKAVCALEPIGKAVIYGQFDKLDIERDNKNSFKTKTAISHPGFAKKPKEELGKVNIMHKQTLSNMKDIVGPLSQWDSLGGLDILRPDGIAQEIIISNTTTNSPIRMNESRKGSRENIFSRAKTKRPEIVFRQGKTLELPRGDKKFSDLMKPYTLYTSPKNSETKISESATNSPIKLEAGIYRSMSTTLKGPFNKAYQV